MVYGIMYGIWYMVLCPNKGVFKSAGMLYFVENLNFDKKFVFLSLRQWCVPLKGFICYGTLAGELFIYLFLFFSIFFL